MAIEIHTDRFLLRELSEDDVTLRYLGWLQDDTAKEFIASASKTDGLETLKRYVQERIGSDNIIFLGIFDKTSGLHIGNIKYEPVDSARGYTIMGIFIGEPAYRGKGVGTEILMSTALWLKKYRSINQILLGVRKDNIAAIKFYERVGFTIAESPFAQKKVPEQIIMAWNIPG